MKNIQKFGPWAIVTGASSGIGHEFAKQLAELGLNVVLVARRSQLLNTLAKELTTAYGVQTRTLTLDLSALDAAASLEEAVADLDVGLLVSNAGAARMGAFQKVSLTELESLARLNVMTQLGLAHRFTARFAKRKQGGGLLMVSSTTAYQGIPFAANYSAAKAYILNLGEALNHELQEMGVNVTVLVPGPTDTPGLSGRTDADMVEHLPMKPQSVESLVAEGLRAIEANRSSHIGGGMNRMVTRMMNTLMPRSTAVAFWGSQMKKMVHDK